MNRTKFRLFFDASTKALIEKCLKDSLTLESIVSFRSGLIGKEGQEAIVSRTQIGRKWLPGIISGGEIKRYAITIPLHVDVVSALQELRNGAGEADPVFKRVPRIERFRRDLKKAGVEYVRDGNFGDFHSLRKTFGTNLHRKGVSPRVAMELMRHSDMRLTAKIYTDAMQLPTAEAIEALPSFDAEGSRSQLCSQRMFSDCHNLSQPGTVVNGKDIEQTIENKG